MKSRSTITILLGSALTAALVGCGNRNSRKEMIEAAPGAKGGLKAQQCSQAIGSSEIHVDSEKMKVSGKSIAAPLCMQAELLSDYSSYTSEKPETKAKYQLSQPQRRSYTVGKGEGKSAKISLNLGIDYVLFASEQSGSTDPANDKLRLEAFNALKADCVGMLMEVWKKSNPNIDLNIHLYAAGDKSGNDSVVLDQTLTLAGPPASSDLKSPRFVMAHWPTHGQLYTRASGEVCRVSSCTNTERTKANRLFCAHFARLIGQYLGLSASETASSQACSAQGFADGATSDLIDAPKPTPAQASFMSFDPNAPDFWEKARFSTTDLKAIVGPACFGQAAPAKAKVSFGDPTPVDPSDDD